MHTLQQWSRKRKIITGLALILLAIVLNGIIFAPGFSLAGKTLSLLHLTRSTVSASGILQNTVYNLNFEESGPTISEIDVKQGQSVVAGQVLARLKSTTFHDAVNVALAAVNAAHDKLRIRLVKLHAAIAAGEALIAAGHAAFDVALANQDAINNRSDATIHFAIVKLNSDRNTLNQVIKAADAQIAAADAQKKQSLLSCKEAVTPTTTATKSTTTSTSTSSTTPPTPPTPTTTKSKDTSTSISTTATKRLPGTYSACVDQANTAYEQAVSAADAVVASAQATVAQDEAALVLAHAVVHADNVEARGNVINAHHGIDVDVTAADLVIADSRKDVVEAHGDLEVALANLTQAEHNLAGATLKASHSGVVTAVNGTVGGDPGTPTNIAVGNSAGGGPFIRLVDLSSAGQIQASVDESAILKVEVGQPVQFTVKAYGSRQFQGTVSAISPEGVSGSNGMSYPVIIDVDPSSVGGARLLSNMTVNVTIIVG